MILKNSKIKLNQIINHDKYLKQIQEMRPRTKELYDNLQNNNLISDHFIPTLKEATNGAIIRKIVDANQQPDTAIKKTIEKIIGEYVLTFNKYFPDDTISYTLEDHQERKKPSIANQSKNYFHNRFVMSC